jgi:hypothetical protein
MIDPDDGMIVMLIHVQTSSGIPSLLSEAGTCFVLRCATIDPAQHRASIDYARCAMHSMTPLKTTRAQAHVA